jgi:hypothetical protein
MRAKLLWFAVMLMLSGPEGRHLVCPTVFRKTQRWGLVKWTSS